MTSLLAVEPERRRGILDGDTPDGEGGSVGGDGHKARGDTRCGRGLERARVGKGRLRDGVVLGVELEVDCVASIEIDAGGVEGKLAIRTNSNGNVGCGSKGGGRSDKESGGETHFKELRKAGMDEVSGDDY